MALIGRINAKEQAHRNGKKNRNRDHIDAHNSGEIGVMRLEGFGAAHADCDPDQPAGHQRNSSIKNWPKISLRLAPTALRSPIRAPVRSH